MSQVLFWNMLLKCFSSSFTVKRDRSILIPKAMSSQLMGDSQKMGLLNVVKSCEIWTTLGTGKQKNKKNMWPTLIFHYQKPDWQPSGLPNTWRLCKPWLSDILYPTFYSFTVLQMMLLITEPHPQKQNQFFDEMHRDALIVCVSVRACTCVCVCVCFPSINSSDSFTLSARDQHHRCRQAAEFLFLGSGNGFRAESFSLPFDCKCHKKFMNTLKGHHLLCEWELGWQVFKTTPQGKFAILPAGWLRSVLPSPTWQ